MRLSLRSAILLGCGIAALQTGTAWADDPLMPEGGTAPVKGRELLLPPMINNAPPGATITLPPPGQEHRFGPRPADEQALVVPASTDLPPVQQAEKGVAPKRKPKKAKRSEPVAVAAAPAAPEKTVVAGVQKTAVPEQSLVVPEAGANTQIVEANGRLTDPPLDGMGGPELSGPPKPKDGMRAEPIRDGDKLTRRQARALAETKPTKAETAVPAPAQKAPAIERLQLATATAAPTAVVAAEKSAARIAAAAPTWRYALSAAVGFGTLEGGQQSYLGGLRPDDSDDVLTYEAAAKINLTGLVEPLGGGNVEPYLRLAISGRDGDISSTRGFTPAVGPLVIPTATGGAINLAGGAATNARHRGNKDQIRISAMYGQTWRARGFDVSGFAGVAHAWADHDQSFRFVATGNPGGGADTFAGAYDTDLRVNTTSFVLGAGVAVPLSGDGKLKADANVRTSYDIVQGKGRDALRLAVQATDATVHLSAIDMRRTEDSAGFGAGLGLSYAVTNDINVRAGVEYSSHENSPVIVRDSVNASRLEFDREDVLTGTLSASIKF
jgi:opacity protein-like surface antigen